MIPRRENRKPAYLICGILLFLVCFTGAVLAEGAAEQTKLSPEEIVHGLYNPNANPAKIYEDSIYVREGLLNSGVAGALYSLADVYNDDTVATYFTDKIDEGIVNGYGINRHGYFLILIDDSAVDKIPEILDEFDQITEKYGILPVAFKTGKFEVSAHMVVHEFVTSPEDAVWVVRPVYLGYLPSMPEVIEDTIRYTLYPFALFLFTVLSVSGFLLFSRRKNPEEKPDSTPAKILSYLQNHPPASQKKITKEVGVSRGSVRYQIHRLVREGKIFSAEILGRKFYSVSPIAEDKTIQSLISLFDDETDTKICLALFNEGEMSRADIAEKTEMSLDAVYYHLSRMGEDVAEKRIEKGTAYYRLTEKAKEWAAALNIH